MQVEHTLNRTENIR